MAVPSVNWRKNWGLLAVASQDRGSLFPVRLSSGSAPPPITFLCYPLRCIAQDSAKGWLYRLGLLPLGLVNEHIIHGIANGLATDLDEFWSGFAVTPALKRADAHAPALGKFLFCQQRQFDFRYVTHSLFLCCALSALWGDEEISGRSVFSVKHDGFLWGVKSFGKQLRASASIEIHGTSAVQQGVAGQCG